jgi:hypothetical protein
MIKEIIKIHYKYDVDAHDIDHVILPSINDIYDKSKMLYNNSVVVKRNSFDSYFKEWFSFLFSSMLKVLKM